MPKEKEYAKLEKGALLIILSETEKLANVGGWEWDMIKDVWTFSDNWLLIHGCTKRHLSTAELLTIAHPEDRARIQKAFDRAISEGTNYEIEHRIIQQNTGEERYIRACGAPKLDKAGKPVILYGSAQDITVHKLAEDSLKKERELFRTIVDRLPVMITRYDPDANMLFLNTEFEKKIGWITKEVQNIDMMEKVYPDPDYREEAFRYMQKATQEWREFQLTSKTGQIIDSEWSNIKIEDGTQIGIGIDLSEQKKIHKSQIKSESLFQGLYDNMTSGAAIYEVINDGSSGSDYIVKQFNKKSLEIEGKTLEQVVGKSLYDLRPTIDDYGLIPVMKKVWATGEPAHFPTKIYQDENFSNYYENYIFKIPTGELVTIYNDVTEQKNSEFALKKSEERFALAMEFANDGLFDWNLETNEIYYSPVWKSLLGYEDNEIPNDFSVWETLTHPQDVERSWKMQQELINKKRDRFEIEFKMKHKDGHWVDILARANAIFDDLGKAVRIIGTHVDISQRKKTEQTLKENEEKLRNIFENSTNLFYSHTPEHILNYLSPQVKDILGYTQEEAMTKWTEFVSDNPLNEIGFKNTVKAIETGERQPVYELEMVRKDGRKIRVEVREAPLVENGNVVSIVGSLTDITDRKNAEQALKESEAKYRSMMESMTDPVYICSPEFTVEYMNPAMIKRTGRDATGECCHTVLHNLDTKCDWCIFEKIKAGESHEINIVSPKDNRNYRITSMPINNPGGSVSKMTILRDITDYITAVAEKEKAQAQLSQAQKLESIGTLAGGIAHDFNNILSAIIGFTELAIDETPKGSPIEDSLREVYSAGIRAKDLVKQILAFARQSDEKRSPIKPGMVAKEVLKLIRATIPTTIEIESQIESDSLIIGNQTQIHQVLMNLCTNAAHAMEDSGGVLAVSMHDSFFEENELPGDMTSGKYIEIRVSDTGVGIAPENMNSIFEPYFTTKDIGEGTGMGLSMVHGVVESYGGKITVESQLGKGTKFAIYLPITEKSSARENYVSEQLPTGIERILFVDDEASIVRMGSRLLERLGYSVATCTNSIDALELFRTKPDDFDLIVTDMTMPNLTGDKLALEAMRIRPGIPVILCTGYSKKISDESASEIGIKAFAYKPFVKVDLAKMVRKVLDDAKS